MRQCFNSVFVTLTGDLEQILTCHVQRIQILTPLVLSVVTASRTLHPTPFKSCTFFLTSVFLLFSLLPSTFFVQSAKALFQCYSNQQSQCDHRKELVIDFCKIFGLFFVVVVFFNLFKCEVFFIVNLKSFFYFPYFSAFLFH